MEQKMAEAQGSLSMCAGCSDCTGDGEGQISATSRCPELRGQDGSHSFTLGWLWQLQVPGSIAESSSVRGQWQRGPPSSVRVSCQRSKTPHRARSCPGLLRLCELRLDAFCIPQPPWRLGKARWSSADGCHPELQAGGPGGLLQLAGMR